MSFTNREIATYLWLGGALAVALLWKPKVRRRFADVLRAFAKAKLLLLFGSAAIYIALWVFLFASIGLWTAENLKTTSLWAVSFVFVSFWEVTRIDNSDEVQSFFVKLIRDTLALTGVLTFVVELHSFSLPVELLTVPLLSLVYLLHAVAEREPKAAPVRTFLSVVLVTVGLWYLFYSLYMALADLPEIASLDTLREFGTPILLSLAFLPFLYGLLLVVTYENAFVRLRWQIPDEKLRRRAKWEALCRFGPRVHLLRKWIANLAGSRPTNAGEIRRSFNETMIAAKHEASPPFIKPTEGWSPYRAKAFLKSNGLETGEYHRGFEDEWWASSPYLELGDSVLSKNNLAYYVTGTERVATSLKLTLNVNRPEEREKAEARFIEVGRALLEASLGLPAAEPAIRALVDLQPREIRIDTKITRLTYEEWVGGIHGGYDRSLEIKHVD